MIRIAEHSLGLVLPRAFLVVQLLRERAGPFDEVAVGAQPREAQVAPARLSRAEQLPLAAELEVDLGELEAVRGLAERLQPRLGDIGQLRLVARDQQAVALLGPAPHPAAQLMEL